MGGPGSGSGGKRPGAGRKPKADPTQQAAKQKAAHTAQEKRAAREAAAAGASARILDPKLRALLADADGALGAATEGTIRAMEEMLAGSITETQYRCLIYGFDKIADRAKAEQKETRPRRVKTIVDEVKNLRKSAIETRDIGPPPDDIK